MNMAELTRLGVSARADAEGKLILDAPAGVLTPNLLEELRQSKVALLAELAGNVNLVNIDSSCPHSSEKTISPPQEVNASPKVGAGDTAPDPMTPADARLEKVIAKLHGDPGLRYAVEVHIDADPDAVILTLAIRDKAACELCIPRGKYDPFLLLELIERHSGRVH